MAYTLEDPALIEAEVQRRIGALTIVRWCDPTLPAALEGLIAEAQASGVAWIADFPAEWHQHPFTAEGEGLFLALEEGVAVGMAVISADPHVDDTETGRLRYIYVALSARGRGLLRIFVDLCMERGSHWRRLRLHTDNPLAARVYESYGFQPVEDEYRSTHVLGNL